MYFTYQLLGPLLFIHTARLRQVMVEALISIDLNEFCVDKHTFHHKSLKEAIAQNRARCGDIYNFELVYKGFYQGNCVDLFFITIPIDREASVKGDQPPRPTTPRDEMNENKKLVFILWFNHTHTKAHYPSIINLIYN